MKVVFLGTNGWYDTEMGNTVCTLIETDNYFIILDAGNGIYKIDQYINKISNKPISLFISHFHIDHISGLHIMNKFGFTQGMHIYGQEGTKDNLEKIINIPFTIPFARLPFKVDIIELSEGTHNFPFSIECRFLHHSSPCMGYRFELEDKIIAYCPDTGVCENALKLARNSDLLIAECSFKSGQSNPQWPHLNPEDAAQIARDSNAKKLALIHFDANIYQTLQQREIAQENAKKIFNNTIAAKDEMIIEI
jgi:ribonuclease BN (tRNA processing enzyme)